MNSQKELNFWSKLMIKNIEAKYALVSGSVQ